MSRGFFDRKSASDGYWNSSTAETESLPGTWRRGPLDAETRQRHQQQRHDNNFKLHNPHRVQQHLPTQQPLEQAQQPTQLQPQPQHGPQQGHLASTGSGSPGVAAACATPDPAPDSHRFDPVFIDDPLRPGNNVGRNCFRIAAIQRAWLDAADVLRRSMLEGRADLLPLILKQNS